MKASKFRRPPGKKKLWLILGAGITAVAVAVGIFAFLPGRREPVNVYPFSYIGMTEYWGDNQESYGPVSTDKIQTVFLSETQTVTELLVKEGDQVKKGDLLMTFDTTLSELQLERKRLEMEKEKLQLEQEKNRLNELLGTTPWEPPPEQAPAEPDPGIALTGTFQIKGGDGSTQEKAVVCWLKSGATVNSVLLGEIYEEVLKVQAAGPSNPSAVPQLRRQGVLLSGTVTNLESREGEAGEDASESGSDASSSESSSTSSSESSQTESSQTESSQTESSQTESSETESSSTSAQESSTDTTKDPDPTQSTESTEPTGPEGSFYVIFRTSQDNMSNKEVLTWEGLHVQVVKNGFSFQFFPAYYLQELDPFYVVPADQPVPDLDFSFGYTAAELHKMINEQRKTIRDQEFKVRVAENAYKIMEKELSDGNIYAEIDGSIVSLLDEEESKLNKQPFLKLSGGGGFLVKGSVSELEKDNLTLGQEVTVSDWNTGGSYPGTIQEIGDFPSPGDGWNGMGNPTATFYPFTVFVDESADLQAGIYASIQYSSGSGSHGIYLENPFIRTEDGQSYVLVQNSAGRLEKRTVTLGKSLWGSYTEILSGVTEEDFLAFPYGKEARTGAHTREGSLEELYQY